MIKNHNGFTLASLIVIISIMMILWAIALPVWEKLNQREKELELIWRGKQYAKAIERYSILKESGAYCVK